MLLFFVAFFLASSNIFTNDLISKLCMWALSRSPSGALGHTTKMEVGATSMMLLIQGDRDGIALHLTSRRPGSRKAIAERTRELCLRVRQSYLSSKVQDCGLSRDIHGSW